MHRNTYIHVIMQICIVHAYLNFCCESKFQSIHAISETVSLNKSAINKLDKCIKLAVAEISNVKDDNIYAVREYCDLPYIVILLKKDI